MNKVCVGLIILAACMCCSGMTSDACLGEIKKTSNPGLWNAFTANITIFLKQVRPSASSQQRVELTQLRADLINLEVAKMNLATQLEKVVQNPSKDAWNTAKGNIDQRLTDISRIANVLHAMGENGGAFANEKAFKELQINLDQKRTITLCQISVLDPSVPADKAELAKLITDLNQEIKAISDADEELAKYIKNNFKN